MARRWFVQAGQALPQSKEAEEIVGVLRRLEDAVSALYRQVDRLAVIIPLVEAQAHEAATEPDDDEPTAAGEVPDGAGPEAH